ncbi:hypothetical protein AMS68_003057 [Peltaster fructicola]|uniref:Thioesterase domain-containing protein n=1 Tax=Peltaster fructicola TaxID=286661 RepID=A0A6H0XSV1_9PEZI|nr:hypothetical protein AMS68_003057 [Peltaster fructicola]
MNPKTREESVTTRNERTRNKLGDFRKTYLAISLPDNFDRELWEKVSILSACVDTTGTSGKAVYSLTVPARYCNYTGNVHGGAVATILDGLTNCCTAIVSRNGFWDYGGVTRSFSINYIRPVEQNREVMVYCEIVHASSRTITIHAVMKRTEDDKVLAMCTQEMVMIVKPKL